MKILLTLLASLLPFVNPFLGTGGNGNASPGAAYPFGMMQISPITHFGADSLICGFSHTPLSGTEASEWCDLRVMPAEGFSSYSHAHEQASPGYYEVYLDSPKVLARMTVGRRAGMHEYTFPQGCEPMLIVDLRQDGGTSESGMKLDGANTYHFYGGCRSSRYGNARSLYFYMEFSRPVISSRVDSTVAVLHFKPGRAGNTLDVRVGISSVSCECARLNLLDENIMSFNGLKEYVENEWENFLSTEDCPYEDPGRRTLFYSSLYRCGIHPSLYSDANGSYFSSGKIWNSMYFDRYSVFPLHNDVYGLYPLLREYAPALTSEFIRSMLAVHQERGRIPDYGSAPAIADAILNGIPGIPQREMLGCLITCSYADGFGLDSFRHNGCVLGDDEAGSVAQTLHYAYYDWCVAQIAGYLAEIETDETMREHYVVINKRYMTSAQYWRNAFDPVSGCMRVRRNGRWAEPSLQDSFFVPHDMMGLVRAMGGPTKFCSKLDSVFTDYPRTCSALPYLYAIAGKQEKTDALVDTLLAAGIPQDGNDCTHTSAWYILSSLGKYPACPANPGPDKTWIAKTVVVNPVFEMETDVITDSLKVGISNIDIGCKAYYSIGGGDFVPYSEPFTIHKPDTLRCFCENLNGKRSFIVQSVISSRNGTSL